jgi:1,4-dihydroxy-2-naphthoate polyprenyltransferase
MRADRNNIRIYIRALRLPFITASVLPFIYGSLKSGSPFRWSVFFVGLASVAAAHLSANLINDYADSRSGADWQEKKYYGLFGGSKLIQEGVLSERSYLAGACVFGGAAALCAVILSLLMKSFLPAACFSVIIFLAWSYSEKPLQLSYRRAGEPVIFVLFGLAPVMGGYYLQGGAFPDIKSFCLALPFGFLTTAILFVNEVPDHSGDIRAGKKTWVSFTGPEKSYIVYLFLELLGFLSVIVNTLRGYGGIFSLAALIFIFVAVKAANVLKIYPWDKSRLVGSSKLTIAIQALVSLVLIVDVWI